MCIDILIHAPQPLNASESDIWHTSCPAPISHHQKIHLEIKHAAVGRAQGELLAAMVAAPALPSL